MQLAVMLPDLDDELLTAGRHAQKILDDDDPGAGAGGGSSSSLDLAG